MKRRGNVQHFRSMLWLRLIVFPFDTRTRWVPGVRMEICTRAWPWSADQFYGYISIEEINTILKWLLSIPFNMRWINFLNCPELSDLNLPDSNVPANQLQSLNEDVWKSSHSPICGPLHQLLFLLLWQNARQKQLEQGFIWPRLWGYSPPWEGRYGEGGRRSPYIWSQKA